MPARTHIVNIVTFSDGSKYHSDVVFGGDGPTLPMPLVDGLVHHNLGTQEIRLVHDWIPTQTQRTDASKLWIYQYRNSRDKEWNSFYAFPELEFMAAGWEVVNWWATSSPKCSQVYNLLVVKFLSRPKKTRRHEEMGSEISEGEEKKLGEQPEEEEEKVGLEIYAKRMLVDCIIKENLGGKTKAIRELKTEEERIQALEIDFGIRLTDEEKAGIKGWVAELKMGGTT